ncbi:unnamed protein product [Fraxinus pennsylvanica]|uniref:Uncharacterized protein n=1 Tax=Fraxinus pennsylvanica TaxID=56036 RepID=A0AAD2ABJ9_9LAMI|nr:unnamed protein product [Fraxinus pennsylvanica]
MPPPPSGPSSLFSSSATSSFFLPSRSCPPLLLSSPSPHFTPPSQSPSPPPWQPFPVSSSGSSSPSSMKKSYELLKGKIGMGFVLVFGYLAICGVINGLFGSIVVHGGEDYGVLTRIMVGGFLVGILVIVNLVGLLVQSVFYYVCKSYHHQGIDKSALYDHLGGYLGEYVPLKSSIQMENMDV